MDPRGRKAIMFEGEVREPSPIETVAPRILERDLEGSPLKGKPLPRRLRGGFSPSIEIQVASLGGPLPYMVRLREIEAETARHTEALAARRRELAEEHAGDAGKFARCWRQLAERWSFYTVNDLIDRHNRYFPAEARLPMDPRTQDFVLINGERYERKPLDAAWILKRFTAELEAAGASEAAA